ncbi:YggS family pyridoxal phosphate-dependent enzyme [Kozakia baliensis]|uniref:YggS family pyridoxal phosphate-dependent enzyme n=1 Tax=Kozakia baliensis TaxID=153496 RepID=UPI00345B86AC
MPINDISARLADIHARMAAASRTAGRDPASTNLVAVSKFHPASSIEAALEAGQRLFGENRVQEAREKFPALRESWPDLRLHIIGGLQTNKALDACRLADAIESLDRPALSDAIARAGDKIGRLPHLFVQVNTGDEPQKFGIPREEAHDFILQSRARFGEQIVGLMCIPPDGQDAAPHFDFLAALAREHNLPEISMGMSGDFEMAIVHGATLIRVGTAIFGQRPLQS